MSKRKVVVTGYGITSCFGSDVDRFYERLLKGESGAVALQGFENQDFPAKIAAYVTDFNPDGYIENQKDKSTYFIWVKRD